ncbi:MAG: YeiH family protein [Sporolactobacillus sp.]
MPALHKKNKLYFLTGIGLTLLIALLARYMADLPYAAVLGQLVIAILLGILWRATIGLPQALSAGVNFSSKKLLRVGIIFLGMRLNLADIYHAGLSVFLFALVQITFALIVVYGLSRAFGVEKKLGMLTACGTAICGAAAVVAVAPQVKASDDETAVGVATVAILGTLFTLAYTLLHPLLALSARGYGIFAGGTLHEIAHVVAAASVGGAAAVNIAVIVKLTRVAMLVPVAFLVGFWAQRGEKKENRFSWSIFPWFILGFLVMSGVNTLGVVPAAVAGGLVNFAYLLIAMAMAGLGLNVHLQTFRRLGVRSFMAGLAGSVCLSVLGYTLVRLLGLN